LDDAPDLTLDGSEEELRQRILTGPDILEEGFQPMMTERETPAGAVDIYGKDADETPMIVELKRRRVGPDAVGQLNRYVDALERGLPVDRSVRGMLVAPSVTDRAEELLATEELEFVSLAPADAPISSPTQLSEFENRQSSTELVVDDLKRAHTPLTRFTTAASASKPILLLCMTS
jgi:RecB family endonuclease NucS